MSNPARGQPFDPSDARAFLVLSRPICGSQLHAQIIASVGPDNAPEAEHMPTPFYRYSCRAAGCDYSEAWAARPRV